MSTYIYLECKDHDPPLRSNYEVGQHDYDLPTIRRYIAQREALVTTSGLAAELGVNFDDNWLNTAAGFLSEHPKCTIGIRDEYGKEHSITDG